MTSFTLRRIEEKLKLRNFEGYDRISHQTAKNNYYYCYIDFFDKDSAEAAYHYLNGKYDWTFKLVTNSEKIKEEIWKKIDSKEKVAIKK